ncbi:MAG TPA: methylated-DNA--[protein]-cysteine S-methyltransferase [Candidatus Deferrimicrobiaceae bacterium]|nr:methylated-DNA--[protein]-cysteine S-methyltransferase [Candidatus Deferrimicrobiaceae bacterium]
MSDGKTQAQDQLDRLLADYFRPDTAPAGLGRKIMAAARESATELTRLEAKLAIEATSRGISLVRTGRAGKPATAAARKLTEQAREEIHEYLRGQRAFFRVPVDLADVPDFQRKVLEAARLIPFGEARPYAWIAARIGHPRAVRAVGTALGRNPVPLILPCHRVWRSDGGLGGYIFGAAVKDRLAALERATPVLEGCTSTRIVCRVGCIHGRHMRPDNRVVFASVDDARSVGYRPCKVCRPAA